MPKLLIAAETFTATNTSKASNGGIFPSPGTVVSANVANTNWADVKRKTPSNGTWRYRDPSTITNRKRRFDRTQQLA